MTRGFLKDLLRLNQTVFSFKELNRIWPNTDLDVIKSRINYYVKHGDLYHIRRGLYAKDKNYDHFEVANKIYIPSYISFETVLRAAGVTFQYYREIFVASYQSKSIEIDGQTYTFKTIKSSILLDATGIELKENYSIATPERAFLDIIYIYKDYHFDNLGPLNWDKVYEILPIYGDNKHMQKMVAMYHQSYKDSL